MRRVAEGALAAFGPAQAEAARERARRFDWGLAAEAYIAQYLRPADDHGL
jgi:hypothetical protein